MALIPVPPHADPMTWAIETFGEVDLGDVRRTQRVVTTAAAMAEAPQDSFPRQLKHRPALQATYRLLAEEDVTLEALLAPHQRRTRAALHDLPVVLLVQDTSTIDYTHFRSTEDLGPIGDGHGKGYLLQSVLALAPAPRQVLGLLHGEAFLRQPVPHPNETIAERQGRPRESEVWLRAVDAIGRPSEGQRWVHVGDAYSDIFAFFAHCRTMGTDFLVRAAQDRRVQEPDASLTHTFAFAQALPACDTRAVALPGGHGQQPRSAQLAIGWGPVTVQPPKHTPKQAPIPLWVLRVWEPAPPSGVEAVDWVLLSSVGIGTVAEAWERVTWYRYRWVVEDYHQGLKTGCGIERRRLGDKARLFRLLGLVAPLAVRLLQLREAARLEPERPALEVVPAEEVQVVAALAHMAPTDLNVQRFWVEVAKLGGYLGRRRDGPPGWKSLWHGWQHIQTLLDGVHLASRLPPRCG